MIMHYFLRVGIVSSQTGLVLCLWVTIQVSFTLLAVYAPVFFKRLIEHKWKRHCLHIGSLLAGIASVVIPSILILGLAGYTTLDTKFPPIVCYSGNYRSVSTYVFLIPCGILYAIAISELVVLYQFLARLVGMKNVL